ncbi:hypothetical protein FOV72_19815 [Gordonia rubripertincta]|uniref:hypothetical protein n=1 Tax=Gordonia rubripertincta TaxID=36822 RepID=UPI0011805DBF|nr:hypothetical protein [Gordonia rubripertincta]TSD93510.1 hypothetical protein FOV72_19815 [Gordonia rubripertincta]
MFQTTPQQGPFNDANCSFLLAIDSIDAEALIDDSGRVHIAVETVEANDGEWSSAMANISTWALITEPTKDRAERPVNVPLGYQDFLRGIRLRTSRWLAKVGKRG